jgi:Transcriptional regulatory protein, C terminal
MDNSRLYLNGHTVDLQRETVTKLTGQKIMLRPKTAEVLKVLAARHDELVTKDELIQGVWGGVAVGDDSLVQCVIEIRKALGDSKHRIIRTVPKRGYRLDTKAPGHRVPMPGRRSWLAVVTGCVMILVPSPMAFFVPHSHSHGEGSLADAKRVFGNLEADLKLARQTLDNRIREVRHIFEGHENDPGKARAAALPAIEEREELRPVRMSSVAAQPPKARREKSREVRRVARKPRPEISLPAGLRPTQ